MLKARGMMKEPLVKQRSQAPPLTVAVTRASQAATGDVSERACLPRQRGLSTELLAANNLKDSQVSVNGSDCC